MADQLDRLKASSARSRYASLRQFFRWCQDEGEIRESPMARMRPPAVPKQPVPVLAEEELRTLIRTSEPGYHLLRPEGFRAAAGVRRQRRSAGRGCSAQHRGREPRIWHGSAHGQGSAYANQSDRLEGDSRTRPPHPPFAEGYLGHRRDWARLSSHHACRSPNGGYRIPVRYLAVATRRPVSVQTEPALRGSWPTELRCRRRPPSPLVCPLPRPIPSASTRARRGGIQRASRQGPPRRRRGRGGGGRPTARATTLAPAR